MNKGLKIQNLCSIANVSASGYYYWQKNKGNKAKNDEKSRELIEDIFNLKKKKAGIRTIKMILENKHRVVMNLKKIARIKKEYDLETKVRKKNKYNIFAKKQLESRTSSNLLERKFNQKTPDEVYSTDISYLFYSNGRKAYLSATKDLATKEIVCFSVNNNIGLEIVHLGMDGLLSSLEEGKRQNLIIHSDQGFHYTHPIYVNKLKEFGVIQSMSRKGNCLDNAPIESFFGHMKDEVELKTCKTFEEVKNMIESYINYYNNERYQWGLNKMTPAQYRRHLLKET